MQRTTRFGILFLVVALAVALGRLALKPDRSEALHLGKPISYWLTDGFTFTPGVDGRPQAESAFRCMGSNAVPFLIATLGKTDGALKQIYLRCYPKLPAQLTRRLPRPFSADALRGRAILALTLIGPAAKPAIPSLLKLLVNDRDGRRRANALRCLDAIDNGQYQEDVVGTLERARRDPDPLVARTATDTLKRRFPIGYLPVGAGLYEKIDKK